MTSFDHILFKCNSQSCHKIQNTPCIEHLFVILMYFQSIGFQSDNSSLSKSMPSTTVHSQLHSFHSRHLLDLLDTMLTGRTRSRSASPLILHFKMESITWSFPVCHHYPPLQSSCCHTTYQPNWTAPFQIRRSLKTNLFHSACPLYHIHNSGERQV